MAPRVNARSDNARGGKVSFVELKEAIELSTGLGQDALHIYAALLIQILAAAVLRRGIGHPLPWLCVLAAELVNEWLDLRATPLGMRDVWASVHDLWNTMLLPSLLLLIARFAPGLLRPERSRRSH